MRLNQKPRKPVGTINNKLLIPLWHSKNPKLNWKSRMMGHLETRRCSGRLVFFFTINLINDFQLARPKYGASTYKCDKCRGENLLLENRYQIVSTPSGEKRLMHKETFCPQCAQLNIEITDLLMKHSDQTKEKKRGTWGGGY